MVDTACFWYYKWKSTVKVSLYIAFVFVPIERTVCVIKIYCVCFAADDV